MSYIPPSLQHLTLERFRCVGAHYRNGQRFSAFAIATLSNGSTVYIPEPEAYPDGVVQRCESIGVDCTEMRRKLDQWVQTGSFPPSLGMENARP